MQHFDNSQLIQHILHYDGVWPPRSTTAEIDLARQSDEELLALFKSDLPSYAQSAFSEIYNRYHLDVWRFARSKNLSETEAKDIFCDVWAIAFQKLRGFEWEGKPLKSWLMTTTQYKCLEHFRYLKDKGCAPLDEQTCVRAVAYIEERIDGLEEVGNESDSPDILDEADKILHAASGYLSKKERQIVLLIFYKGLCSDQEIAQALQMKEGAVRTARSRLRKKLREMATQKR